MKTHQNLSIFLSIYLLSTVAALAKNISYNTTDYPYTTRQELARSDAPGNHTNITHYAPVYKTTQDLNHKLPVSDNADSMTDRSASGISEHQAAGILKMVNQIEISASKIATKKASNAQIRDFAERMISEHKKNKTAERKLLGKLGLIAEKSHVSEIVKEDADESLRELKKLDGAAFDESYISGQIEMHRAFITDIDQRLIPAATKPELKEFLRTTREHVKHHLADAQEIQNNLGTAIK